MKVILLFNAPREYYRDVIVSQDELYCSPTVQVNTDRTWQSPNGVYDVPAFIASLPERWRTPDILMTHFDAGMNISPCNLAGVKCPKVLVVGDTHHMASPIRKIIAYALRERYDHVIGEFNRQHLHFFVEAGVSNVAWIPSYTLRPFEEFAGTARRRGATFIGQAGQFHPYRRAVLQQLLREGPRIETLQGNQRDTARAQAESQVNLNISLNGDLNLRISEVMAAGGFLITDRLGSQSGLSLLFEENKHLVLFDGTGDLKQKIQHYLANPAEANAIAAAGNTHYLKHHRPFHKVQALERLLRGQVHPPFDITYDRRVVLPREPMEQVERRILAYETLQELHRTNESPSAIFWTGMHRYAADAADLPRLRGFVLPPRDASPLRACGMEDCVAWIEPEIVAQGPTHWSAAVCAACDLDNPLLQQLMTRRRCDWVIVVDYDPTRDGTHIQYIMAQQGWRAASGDPLILTHLPIKPSMV